ncbi:sensor histidine kinase [Microvirga lotononidis]|nr:ATP-binding protein [Microvirga lotononidis]WQO26347.1 histidine kinase [Microvirga lotononidis]
MIALVRLALALFAFIAITLDPPLHFNKSALTYNIAIVYLLFSLGNIFMIALWPTTTQHQIGVHVVDIICACLQIYLNHGSNSPFFILFIFILMSATLQWDWRGALSTTALLVCIFVAVLLGEARTLSEGFGGLNLSPVILRPTNLVVAGIMLGYVGLFQERSRMRLAKLVAWPGPDHEQNASAPLASALRHAAGIMGVPRLLLIWEQPDEPFRNIVLWSVHDIQHMQESHDRFGTIVSKSMAGKCFFYLSKARKVDSDRLIDEDLRQSFSIRSALTAPFQLPLCSGRIFLLDLPGEGGRDALVLAELIAIRLGVDLEHHLLRSEREVAAALTERARLALDLHDGVLQGLAAADIHLKLSLSRSNTESVDHVARTRQVLANEQQRVRAFVEATRLGTKTHLKRVNLDDNIRRLVGKLSAQWDCDFDVTIEPPNLHATEHLLHNVYYILDEALSNAVRHGKASHVDVSVRSEDNYLFIMIRDNGVGLPELRGSYSSDELAAQNIGPHSLRARAMELGGFLTLETSSSGVELNFEIPM